MIDMNTQPIEKRDHNPAGILDVHSCFYTIQGEGPFVGRPAVFFRLAGCNLQCPMCDTDYTSKRARLSPEACRSLINTHSGNGSLTELVVITGGEPFRQNLTPLAGLLLAEGYEIQIETNGTLAPAFGFPLRSVTIVCSPKTGKVNPVIAAQARAFKYVLHRTEVAPDGLPTLALNHPAHPILARPPAGFKGPVYLQPADDGTPEGTAANLAATVENCLAHGYTLGLQVHKLIGKE